MLAQFIAGVSFGLLSVVPAFALPASVTIEGRALSHLSKKSYPDAPMIKVIYNYVSTSSEPQCFFPRRDNGRPSGPACPGNDCPPRRGPVGGGPIQDHSEEILDIAKGGQFQSQTDAGYFDSGRGCSMALDTVSVLVDSRYGYSDNPQFLFYMDPNEVEGGAQRWEPSATAICSPTIAGEDIFTTKFSQCYLSTGPNKYSYAIPDNGDIHMSILIAPH